MTRLGSALVASLAWVLTSACTKHADTELSVAFPSETMAILTDTLETSVFSVSRDDACEDIFERRRTNQNLPEPMLRTAPTSVCSLVDGSAGTVDVGFGTRAFLVIGRRKGSELLMGCEVAYVDDRTPPPVVRLTLFDPGAILPTTTCDSVSARCGGRCP